MLWLHVRQGLGPTGLPLPFVVKGDASCTDAIPLSQDTGSCQAASAGCRGRAPRMSLLLQFIQQRLMMHLHQRRKTGSGTNGTVPINHGSLLISLRGSSALSIASPGVVQCTPHLTLGGGG